MIKELYGLLEKHSKITATSLFATVIIGVIGANIYIETTKHILSEKDEQIKTLRDSYDALRNSNIDISSGLGKTRIEIKELSSSIDEISNAIESANIRSNLDKKKFLEIKNKLQRIHFSSERIDGDISNVETRIKGPISPSSKRLDDLFRILNDLVANESSTPNFISKELDGKIINKSEAKRGDIILLLNKSNKIEFAGIYLSDDESFMIQKTFKLTIDSLKFPKYKLYSPVFVRQTKFRSN